VSNISHRGTINNLNDVSLTQAAAHLSGWYLLTQSSGDSTGWVKN